MRFNLFGSPPSSAMLIINEHFDPDYDALLSTESTRSLTTKSWLHCANLNIAKIIYILCVMSGNMGSYRNRRRV